MSGDDIYRTQIGEYERKFKHHNYQVMRNGAGIKMIAIHMCDAITLVDKGLWDAQKEHYFVIIP